MSRARTASRVDEWGVAPRVVELWALGKRGRAIATELMPEIEAWAAKTGNDVPSHGAVAMAITRYMAHDPVDRRTKKARAQKQVVKAEAEAAVQIVKAQIDAAETLRKYVERIDMEVDRLGQVLERDEETGAIVAPDMKTYYTALTTMSREMRGWITLLVDIKDRLWQHEQYERAFTAILNAVRNECPPEVMQRIADRLRSDSAAVSALSNLGRVS